MCVGVFVVYGHGLKTVRTLFKAALAGLVFGLGGIMNCLCIYDGYGNPTQSGI